MPTQPVPSAPMFVMTLLVRLPNHPPRFGSVTQQLQALGVTVQSDEIIRETPTFIVKELQVPCQELAQGEAVLKAVRAVKGAELMNFSTSR